MQTRLSKSPPNSASGDDARTRVKWSKEQEVVFLDFLSERKEDMHNNTFQKAAFNAAVVKFNTRGSRDAISYSNKWKSVCISFICAFSLLPVS
jgi:hypothetical protein